MGGCRSNLCHLLFERTLVKVSASTNNASINHSHQVARFDFDFLAARGNVGAISAMHRPGICPCDRVFGNHPIPGIDQIGDLDFSVGKSAEPAFIFCSQAIAASEDIAAWNFGPFQVLGHAIISTREVAFVEGIKRDLNDFCVA